MQFIIFYLDWWVLWSNFHCSEKSHEGELLDIGHWKSNRPWIELKLDVSKFWHMAYEKDSEYIVSAFNHSSTEIIMWRYSLFKNIIIWIDLRIHFVSGVQITWNLLGFKKQLSTGAEKHSFVCCNDRMIIYAMNSGNFSLCFFVRMRV